MIFHLAANGKCFSAELFEVVLVTVLERAKNACAIGFYSVSWSYLVNFHVRKSSVAFRYEDEGRSACFQGFGWFASRRVCRGRQEGIEMRMLR